MAGLNFLPAEKARAAISVTQQKKIRAMYNRLAKQVGDKAKSMPTSDLISDEMKKVYLKDLQKDLQKASKIMSAELEKEIKKSMEGTAEAVVGVSKKWLGEVGMIGVEGAMSHVPLSAVNRVASGKLYQSDWTLSKRIWGIDKKMHSDIQTVIAEGIALNKSAYDIAKDVEKYVDPAAAKDWKWSKVYPGTNRKVDYNAQRLARTMVSHAYQASLVESTKDNPWVAGFRWRSAGSKRTCALCRERDGRYFPKEKLPLDHPSGMCTFIAETTDLEWASEDIADWYNGTMDSDAMEAKIDKFAKSLGIKKAAAGVAKPVAKSVVEKTITETALLDEVVTKEMIESLTRYTEADYTHILAANANFEGRFVGYSSLLGNEEKAKALVDVENIKAYLNNSKPYEGKIYRGLGFDVGGDYDEGYYAAFRSQYAEGTTVKADTFQSWTTSKSAVEQIISARTWHDDSLEYVAEVRMSMVNKTGVNIRDLAELKHQEEVLLNVDSKFKVVNVVEKWVNDELLRINIELEEIL